MLVVHPGYLSYSYDLPAARAALKRSIGEFADISGDTGVQVCIGNMPNRECFLSRQPDIDLDGTGLVMDTGYTNTTATFNEFNFSSCETFQATEGTASHH